MYVVKSRVMDTWGSIQYQGRVQIWTDFYSTDKVVIGPFHLYMIGYHKPKKRIFVN